MDKTVTIRKLAYGGEGVTDIDGKVCFVEGALPEEEVRIEITEDKKKFSRARVEELICASPHRESPPCPYVQACGGCQYQHLTYSEELRWKGIQVREYLERSLGVPAENVNALVASPAPYQYRNQVTLHFQRGQNPDEIYSGFIAKDNKTVVDIETCRLACDDLGGVFTTKLAGKDNLSSMTFRRAVDGRVVSGQENELFQVAVGDRLIWTHPKSFFQNNLAVTDKIGTRTAEWLDRKKAETFFDLYSGVGTFPVLAARDIANIICVESNPFSIPALEKNLAEMDAECRLVEGRVEEMLAGWLKEYPPKAPVVMFLDPPRSGLDARVGRLLAQHRPADTLIYLSCHLGTLTRDLKTITAEGHYRIAEVVPYDMFPRTKHIEILVRLEKTG